VSIYGGGPTITMKKQSVNSISDNASTYSDSKSKSDVSKERMNKDFIN
jgi:hypothetical protein